MEVFMKGVKNTHEHTESTSSNDPYSDKLGLDKPLHAWFGHFSGWLSPSVFSSAYFDWLTHFSQSPDKKIAVVNEAAAKYLKFLIYLLHSCSGQACDPCVEGQASDKRFENILWDQFPFNVY